MQTLTITRADLDDSNTYIGAADVSDWPGHIEIAADLGRVKFPGALRATGRIRALAGSGIAAGWGIEAGSGIKAGWGIKAGYGIKAGEGIEAGWGIEAGYGIKAGYGIEAGSGIKAGYGIKAKFISVRLRIFAGICAWRVPTAEEMQIRAEVRSGTVAFGEVVTPVNAE